MVSSHRRHLSKANSRTPSSLGTAYYRCTVTKLTFSHKLAPSLCTGVLEKHKDLTDHFCRFRDQVSLQHRGLRQYRSLWLFAPEVTPPFHKHDHAYGSVCAKWGRLLLFLISHLLLRDCEKERRRDSSGQLAGQVLPMHVKGSANHV